ncbi:NAD(P)-binding domain-containing protein, partial [Pseudomonas syringae group genomosp. 7]|uniref:NAD(P)-binding domain-containing protein n=1 Tax=Pseudomonas syringae group genomosp. 7 TaxID=251699 RepID=UPI00376F7F32
MGLGRMGGKIGGSLMLNGHTTVVYDRDEPSRNALANDGSVADSGEGRWTLEEDIDHAVPVRLRSSAPVSYTQLRGNETGR